MQFFIRNLAKIVFILYKRVLEKPFLWPSRLKDCLIAVKFGILKRSTVTQLLTDIDKCCESTSEGKVVDCIYFDFAKAFDTVPHRRLCKKLARYGIKGPIFDWIVAFLNGRKQLVKVNQSKSTTDDVNRC